MTKVRRGVLSEEMVDEGQRGVLAAQSHLLSKSCADEFSKEAKASNWKTRDTEKRTSHFRD